MESVQSPVAWIAQAALSWILLVAGGAGAAASTGCGAAPGDETLTDGIAASPAMATTPPVADGGGVCARPQEGCICDHEGQAISCPGPSVRDGDYVTCQAGVRLCVEGHWGPCLTTNYSSSTPSTTDYTSSCTGSTHVAWRALTVQAEEKHGAPAGRISIAVQTADTQALLDTAPIATAYVTAGSDEANGTDDAPSVDVKALLASAGRSSRAWLRVTLTPAAGTTGAAPSIATWRQASECDGP